MSPPEAERRPVGAASKTTVAAAVSGDGTPRRTTCADSSCRDCDGTGRIGLRACDRRDQYIRRVAWSYWAAVYRDRAA